jgi:subtilase family serine protease
MRHLYFPYALALALTASGCSGSSGMAALPQQHPAASSASAQRVLRAPLGAHSIVAPTRSTTQTKLCPHPADKSRATCFTTMFMNPIFSIAGSIGGLTPSDLSSIYNFPPAGKQGLAGQGQTVGIVVAGNYAGAQNDLNIYRASFGLPPCTSAGGCLQKVGAAATGTTSASGNSSSISAYATTLDAAALLGWAAETDTDTEIISAICPNCKIVIAEAASDSIADLSNAVSAAINANATIVNASFGALESNNDKQFASIYANSRNVKVVAAAGDWGYGVYFPASDPAAIAVGGTTLSVAGMFLSESVWSGTGSGCSGSFAKPAWQHPPAVSGACQTRNVVDVAADADPLTGVAIYDSSLTSLVPTGGWGIFGGTSVAAPIITSMYALSGDTARNVGAQTLYAASSSAFMAFLPVTSGSNGICSPTYLCTAAFGYNGPTGIGVPYGLSGF